MKQNWLKSKLWNKNKVLKLLQICIYYYLCNIQNITAYIITIYLYNWLIYIIIL